MRKRVFFISYTHEDDIDSFLNCERALQLAIAPKWSHFWKDPKHCNVDCVILLDRMIQEGKLHYRSQRDFSLITERLSRYNLYVMDPQVKDQMSSSTTDECPSGSREGSLELEPRKQRNVTNRDDQIDGLYKTVEKLKKELDAKKNELNEVQFQMAKKDESHAYELKCSTNHVERKVITQKRITFFMWHYLLPEHLFTLQHLPKMDKIYLFNRLELIDPIAQLSQAAGYVALIDGYQNDYSPLRQDFNAKSTTYHEIDQQHLDLKDLPSRRPLSISYVDAQNFIQTRLSAMGNGYTIAEDTQVVSIYKSDQDANMQISVENTTQAADLHKVVMGYIDLTERQAGLQLIATQTHHSLGLPAPTPRKTIHWHIKPVVCGDHFWVMAYHVDVENRQFYRLILDSSPMEVLAKTKALLDMEQSLGRSGYEVVECKNVFFKNPATEYQLDSYNSGLYVIRNIRSLLDLKERWWDLYSGSIVELDVENLTSNTRLIKHAELIYFCMAHEICSVFKEDSFEVKKGSD